MVKFRNHQNGFDHVITMLQGVSCAEFLSKILDAFMQGCQIHIIRLGQNHAHEKRTETVFPLRFGCGLEELIALQNVAAKLQQSGAEVSDDAGLVRTGHFKDHAHGNSFFSYGHNNMFEA